MGNYTYTKKCMYTFYENWYLKRKQVLTNLHTQKGFCVFIFFQFFIRNTESEICNDFAVPTLFVGKCLPEIQSESPRKKKKRIHFEN